MTTEKLDIDDIYLAAIEQRAEDRSIYLEEVCGGNMELRNRVERLLATHTKVADFLESPAPELSPPKSQAPSEKPGDTIDSYKLLQEIGEGGMGVVYMAEQTEPVSRKVALKIIKPGMDTRQVIARFEVEQQALAMMDHPNIAKVHDGGTTESGRPYFVMELVKGLPITHYCDHHQLDIRQRLHLFVSVCHAIQHAHQKGTIHRDIKPSNVMVALYDDRPVPKIIDFGVAKAIEHRLTEKTVFTQFGQIVGTFEYMSPEQAQLNQLDVDTRSDIYSLGVLLYELLTGETPFDGERLRSAAFDELLRIIRQEDPLRPSAKLSSSGTLPESAAKRKVEPKRLSSLMQGELDWIVLKAIEKDRTRRYETAAALADDIENYLNDEPVAACPPSNIYMLGKFARRNKGWLSTAAAVLATIFVGLTVSTFLVAKERNAAEAAARREAIAAEEANRQRQRAEDNLRESRAAVDRLFTRAAEELAHVPHMTKVRRTLLEDAAEFYESFVKQKSDDPEILFEMGRAYERLGFSYEFLGRYADAVKVTKQAKEIIEKLIANDPKNQNYKHKLTNIYLQLAVRLKRNDQTEQSIAAMRQSLENAEQLARKHPTVASYRRKEARIPIGVANQMGSTAGVEQKRIDLCRLSLARWEKFRQDFPNTEIEPWEEGHSHHWLASNLMKIGEYEEAEAHLRKSREIRQQLLEKNPKDDWGQSRLGHVETYLARALREQGKMREAEEVIQSAMKVLRPLVDSFPNHVIYRNNLKNAYLVYARILLLQQRFEEAEETNLRVIEFLRQSPTADLSHTYDIGSQYYNLGQLYNHQGKLLLGAESFREAFSHFEQVLSESSPESSLHYRAKNSLTSALATCPMPQFRNAQRVIKYSKEALQLAPLSGDSWNLLGIGHFRAGNWDEAIEALSSAVELRNDGDASDHYFLAMAHWQRGDKEYAKKLFRQGTQLVSAVEQTSDFDELNFRQEAEKLLGITYKQSPDRSTPEKEEETVSDSEKTRQEGP